MTLALPLFTDHPRTWRDNHFVYPVISRRSRGLSVGINLSPTHVCNFDCVYCSVDPTDPPRATAVCVDDLRLELRDMLASVRAGDFWDQPPFNATPAELRRLSDIAFSGDGEPTASPQFAAACQLAIDESRGARIVVITNATLLHRPHVQYALSLLDQHDSEIWAKLDAGTAGYYRTVNRSTVPFSRVLGNLLDCARRRPIVIQSLFMRLHGQGPDRCEISHYLARLDDLVSQGAKLKRVQVYTVARETAEPYVTALPPNDLDEIVGRIRELGLDAEAFYGPD